MRRLRIVILEHNSKIAANLEQVLSGIFSNIGFSADFRSVDTLTRVLETIESDHCDVLVSDLTFGSSPEMGLTFIKDVKQRYPEVLVVACSSAQPTIEETTRHSPFTFDIFLPKTPSLQGATEVLRRFSEEFVSKFKLATDLNVVISSEAKNKMRIVPLLGKALTERDVRSLARQCLWTGRNDDQLFLPDKATLEPLGGGRSGSFVTSVSVSVEDRDLKFLPIVMKVSPLHRARQEYDNFQRYVKLILPTSWRVHVVGYGETSAWGAIAYSFVFDGQITFEALTATLERGDSARFLKVVDRIFGSEGNIWYSEKYQDTAESLSRIYHKKYFEPEYRRQACKTGLAEHLGTLGIEAHGPHQITIGNVSYVYPERALFLDHHRQAATTICHGDLNSNNVVVSRRGLALTFIDFQDTGRGHVFEDFAALESSVRLYLKDETPEVALPALIEAERELFRSARTKPRLAYGPLVREIRKKAQKAFPTVSRHEYLYAVAAFHYRMMRIKELTPRQKSKMIGALFAALSLLVDEGVLRL